MLLLSLLLVTVPTSDRAAVLSSLLAELAQEQSRPHRRPANRATCVVEVLTTPPLVGQRQLSPNDMKFDAPVGQPRHPWKPDTEAEARARLWYVDPEAPAADWQAQQAIQNAALKVSEMTSGATPGRVARDWLASGQRLGGENCTETIELSEPAIALNHAFIHVGVECGPLCGMQATYVMRRVDGRWHTVDGRISLIS